MDLDELTNRFEYHPPSSDEVKESHGYIRGLFKDLAIELEAELPEGREKALVMTQLEQAMFWSNAAVARNQ